MKMIQFATIVCLAMLYSCSDAHQYDVYVQNDSGKNIKVSYKTLKDRDGIKEETIDLKSGAYQQIISTGDIRSAERTIKPKAQDCHLVAEYVKAYSGEIESNLHWCSSEVGFVIEDIGEGRFTIIYEPHHFE